jgi:hypothetical protein
MPAVVEKMGNSIWWHCPGCECSHRVPVDTTVPSEKPWTWNGSLEKPTLSPSVLCRGTVTCHLYMRDGRLEFLGDCSHALAGKTVEMEPIA